MAALWLAVFNACLVVFDTCLVSKLLYCLHAFQVHCLPQISGIKHSYISRLLRCSAQKLNDVLTRRQMKLPGRTAPCAGAFSNPAPLSSRRLGLAAGGSPATRGSFRCTFCQCTPDVHGFSLYPAPQLLQVLPAPLLVKCLQAPSGEGGLLA